MRVKISNILKKLVINRAGNRCEYCRIPELLANYDFHIEHVVSIQHGGASSPDNLAFCCSFCNWKKGTNLATLLPPSDELVRLFNPRTQNWFEHFVNDGGTILPKTKTGEATIKLLEFNLLERVEIRQTLSIAGFYP